VNIMENRNILITGAARGIGAACAEELAKIGARILLVDIDGDVAAAKAVDFQQQGLAVEAISADVTVEAEIQSLVSYINTQWDGQLDVLVNNAAILDATPLDKLSRDRFTQVQNINQNSVLWMTLAMRPFLKRSRAARVVNVASILGVLGTPDSVAYATAKGGIVNMTRALSIDLADDGILVNCICPGFVDTRMAILPDGSGHEHETDQFQDTYIKYGRIPLKRVAQPEDIAKALSFFCGDACAYVTGQHLLVDGGVTSIV
jgi:NAD(P)-dependent dehydrogenase (short-subunit alcohol dehydrogenase family)